MSGTSAPTKTAFSTVICLLALFATQAGLSQDQSLRVANELELKGQFTNAAATLRAALEDKSLSTGDRKRFRFELDRLDRIRKDFPWTQETLFLELKKSVKGLSRPEYERWVKAGWFDSREIDGTRFFMGSSVGNLFWRHPELASRRLPPKDTRALEKRHWEVCVAIQRAARAEHRPYVLPKRFQVVMTVTASPNAAPAGQTIRAWLPVPREYPFQGGLDISSASAPLKHLDPGNSPIRCAYLEEKAVKDKPTRFRVEYDYTTRGVWFEVDPGKVKAVDTNDPALAQFTREAPHIVFTPEMRALSEQIAGSETNLYLKARRFYDWIAEHIQYSYALEYSTIRNLGDYCRSHRYGDCGQEALLFMTLCRLNGIPARWQSGWNTFPGAKSIHDWAEIYIAPYGWMPVDPYMGIYATQYANSLTPEQKREVRDFYFGGLDQYRLVANSDHSQSLHPPKRSMRSDDVDFQRGELEWDHHNIYFDRYSYELTAKEVKPGEGRVE